jgi:hypothetical protein
MFLATARARNIALILFVGATPVAPTLAVWADVRSIEENIKKQTNRSRKTLE